MTRVATQPVPVLPESAPFTPAQRAWLNGFFAGLFGSGVSSTPATAPDAPQQPQEEESFPWHDPALAMDERMKLAEEKPMGRKLMAAMAQLDCGACGYLCQSYAEAIASGEEKDLTRCAPGGRDTSKKLKELLTLLPADQVTVKGAPPPAAKPTANDRRHAVAARLLRNQPLNATGSAKDTRLIVFDLHNSGMTYKAGDALGVIPENCPESVEWLLEKLDASGAETVPGIDSAPTTLHDALLRHLTITQPPSSLISLMAECATDSNQAQSLRQMVAEEGPGIPPGMEILDLLTQFTSARPKLDAFVAALKPLRPRLYSISSSPKMHADEVHLTVGVVRYLNAQGRQCKGVASTYLAERLRPGQKAKVFVHASHTFGPPPDGSTPMIMIGPGTGIAPFRAFLQDRAAAGHRGRSWLFFGDQRRSHDFLYREEVEQYLVDGTLTRLDTAFSRDQADKCYVQHRMLERAREIWAWLQDGAHFYVCGDAKRMARDVDAALKQIVAEQGGMSAEAAAAYVSEMSKNKRYGRDVY